MIDWNQFHFVRPWWFLALIPIVLIWWFLSKMQTRDQWRRFCDQHLLSHLLVAEKQIIRRSYVLSSLLLAWLFTVIALAGPTWETLPTPVYRSQNARIIILDLSLSMEAKDITPSRIEKAKYKVLDILQRSKEMQTALIVFAGEPFVVSPLTEDANTIASLVPQLSTALMPIQGSHVNLAIKKAAELFEQSGIKSGEIILLTDGMSFPELSKRTAAQIRKKNYTLSVLAIGTEAGSPISMRNGEFLKDLGGAIVLPKLDIKALASLADSGGGKLSLLSHDDTDINRIIAAKLSDRELEAENKTSLSGDIWREQGPWLVLLVLPLALLSFRKGWLALIVLWLPLSQPSYAFEWQDLWRTQDQQAAKAMEQKNYGHAAEKFTDPAWRAAAQYRAGEYEKAAKLLAQMDTADAQYNLGNALAKMGRLQDALLAYESSLKKQSDHKDAKYNRDLVNSLLQKQKQQQEKSDDSKSSDDKDSKQDQQQQSDQQQQKKDSQQSDNAQQESQNQSESQKSKPEEKNSKDSEQKSTEQKEKEKLTAEQEQAEAAKERKEKEEQEKKMQSAQATNEQDSEDQKKKELKQAVKQYLRQVPDDPGGLLREKFRRKHIHRRRAGLNPGPAW